MKNALKHSVSRSLCANSNTARTAYRRKNQKSVVFLISSASNRIRSEILNDKPGI